MSTRADLRLVVAGAALVALAIGLLAWPDSEDDGAGRRPAGSLAAAPADTEVLRLAPAEPGLRALDVDLTARTQTVEARGFSMVAVTWRDGTSHVVRVRVRQDDTWSPWRTLEPLTDGPDRARDGTADEDGEATDVSGTDLRWVGPSDAVEVDVSGERPAALTLVLMDPQQTAADRAVTPAERRHPTRKPPLLSRKDWGADPRLRSGRPSYNRTIQQVHVHHTVNSNGYAKADVPGLLRGIYRYHTRNLGWSDIGYNFVVDRFGRTWTGRAGGSWQAVQGAHTLGFNSTSTGVAVIGNFEDRRPDKRIITAIVRLAAWKLFRADRNPEGKVRVFSHGSDRFEYGRKVWLPVIDGHRDTNETACPGARLYRWLPAIRERAARRVARY